MILLFSLLKIFFGGQLGMALLIAVKSCQVQIGSKYELNFVQAFRVYTTKYLGPIVVGNIVILIAMFILPNLIAVAQNATENVSRYDRIVNDVIKWLSIWSVALGIVSQGVGFLMVNNGERYLKEAEKKLNDQ